MLSTKLFEFAEHGRCDDPRLYEALKAYEIEDTEDLRFLGLTLDHAKHQVQADYYIGMRWIHYDEEKALIYVKPKRSDNESQVDYERIFINCLNHPIVSRHLQNCFQLFFNEPAIKIDKSEDILSPMLILSFLGQVNKIVKKGLKRDFVDHIENLNGKIKGKILITTNIKANISKNVLTKTICKYQRHSLNSLENKIIKAALYQVRRFVFNNLQSNKEIIRIFKRNWIEFEKVQLNEVFTQDFIRVKTSPFFKEYKTALALALQIFKHLGWSINQPLKSTSNQYQIPPFYINMPELFERYCEVLLRNHYGEKLLSGYGFNETSETEATMPLFKLRPDFLLEKKIIDAKYKYLIAGNISKKDLQQVALYGRSQEILLKIGIIDNEAPELIFLLPYKSNTLLPSLDLDNNLRECPVSLFKEIYEYYIPIPLKQKRD